MLVMMQANKLVLKFQKRDLELFRGLFESRVMTAGHVSTLYFDGKREYAKKRCGNWVTSTIKKQPRPVLAGAFC